MRKSFAFVAVAILAFAGSAFAQNTSTATGNASARVILPIQIFAEEALNFGSFFSGSTNGTVTITASNVDGGQGTSRVAAGGAVLYTGTSGATWQQGEFDVDGEPGFTYALTGYTGTKTLTSGSNSMTYVLNAPIAISGGTVGVCGTQTPDNDAIEFGAVLTVPANSAPGIYTGTYTVTAT